MKVIIAGSRNIVEYSEVFNAIKNSSLLIHEVVSGGARGVDDLGEKWAYHNGRSVKLFIPDWDNQGKKAGILRNIEMGNYADALIAVWDGKSRGTQHMIEYMRNLGKPVFVHIVNV